MADWKSTNLKIRVISSIIGIPLFLLFLYLGKIFLFIFLLLIAFVAFYEFLNLQKNALPFNLVSGFITLLVIGYAFFTAKPAFAFIPLVFLFIVWVAGDLLQSLRVVSGSYYISLLFFLILIRTLPNGFLLCATVVILTWIFDIGSYFGGVAFGKHKLIPTISPGKSYEGLITGLICVIALSFFAYFLPIPVRIILGIVIAVFSLTGDIIESKIKRLSHAKDSGSIIPGHGGFLDRFDSLILSIPAGYYFLVILIGLKII